MRDVVEIGLGKTAQRGYHLDDIAIVPSRRTRDVDDVSTEWRVDAYPFKIPCVAHPSDATMSPASAIELGRLGGLGVLNAEGLWTRYEDPTKVLEELAALDEEADATRRLVIQGTLVSAEHVSTTDEPLNLKEFIADLDLPVIVGGCTDYKTALHLMRTGAAGVIVGVGADEWSTTDTVLGIRVPMATAIADAAAARRDYLDETGGRYVHLIADGGIQTSGDIAKAIGCGADAVMLGEPLSLAEGAPAGGAWWHSAASHPSLPRGGFCIAGEPDGTLEELLFGPATRPDGQLNLFGGLKRAMAKCGYHDVKEFQKVALVLDRIS